MPPIPFFPPVPCSTPASSRASCSYHRFSSRAMSSVTGTSVICSPSCTNEDRINVAVSGSAFPDDASDLVTAVSRSFRSPARRTISRALTIRASRSFSASFISSCADRVEVSTPRTRPSRDAPSFSRIIKIEMKMSLRTDTEAFSARWCSSFAD